MPDPSITPEVEGHYRSYLAGGAEWECAGCGQIWPCLTERLVAEVQRLRTAVETASPQDAPSAMLGASQGCVEGRAGTSGPPGNFNPSERLWAFLEELTSEVAGIRAQLALVGTGVDRLGAMFDGLERRAEG